MINIISISLCIFQITLFPNASFQKQGQRVLKKNNFESFQGIFVFRLILKLKYCILNFKRFSLILNQSC